MTINDRVDRVPQLLSELAAPRIPDYYDDILARTAGQRQRPARTLLERILPMSETTLPSARTSPPVRTFAVVLLLAALAVAIAAGALIASRPPVPLPAPFGPAANGLIPYVSNGDIYVGDPVSGTTRLLVGGPAEVALPQFSPDGTRVAFIQAVTGAATPVIDIYVVREDGSGLHKITPQPIDDTDTGWKSISWTPDGRQIAVVHQVLASGVECGGVSLCDVGQLDLYDATGSGAVKAVMTAAGMDFVQFRPPDGREILYRALVDGKWGLFAMDADGANVRPVVAPTAPAEMDSSFGGAVYSADGSRIFYQHGDATGCCQLWVANADGSDQHAFIPNSGEAWDGGATVSPDGSRIAFWHNPNGQPNHGVFVTRADGSGPLIETGPALSSLLLWRWAPDSSKILMYPKDASNAKAYLLDPDGGPWTTVPWASDNDLDWQRVAP